MAFNWIEGELIKLGDPDLANSISGVRNAFIVRHPEMADIPLPTQEVIPEETQASKVDLRQQTYEILGLARESSDDEKTLLERMGFVSLLILAKTVPQIAAEYPEVFWHRLGYIDGMPQLRDYRPPVMNIALNPQELALPGSFSKGRITQLMMIGVYSRTEIEPIIPGARAIMLPASAYIQADIEYFKKTGQLLFRNCSARALDDTSAEDAAYVGRYRPGDRLYVDGFKAGDGGGGMGAVPAIIFLR